MHQWHMQPHFRFRVGQQTTRRLTESGGRRELGLDEVTGAGRLGGHHAGHGAQQQVVR